VTKRSKELEEGTQVTYQQDQEDQAQVSAQTTDDEYPDVSGDADVARAEPDDYDDDDDMILERDVIVAEVIDEEPDGLDGDGDGGTGVSDETAPSSMPAQTSPPTTAAPTAQAEAVPAEAVQAEAVRPSDQRMSQQWHDIQAGFVDDPRGAVRLAAQAADDALAALVTALRERQSALGSADATVDTEVLRSTLREYRQFCEGIDQVERQLPQPVSGH